MRVSSPQADIHYAPDDGNTSKDMWETLKPLGYKVESEIWGGWEGKSHEKMEKLI